MTASYQDIKGWVERARATEGVRWLIVGRDNYDYSNYPIFVLATDDFYERYDHLGDNGTGGMGDSADEVYDLTLDIDSQLAERRAYHLPPRPSKG